MPTGAATLRLMACVEAFSHQEDGACSRDDWPALAALLSRELDIVSGLVQAAADDPAAAQLAPRAEAVIDRLKRLDAGIQDARKRDRAEITDLNATSRRLRAVNGTYARRPVAEPRPPHFAAA